MKTVLKSPGFSKIGRGSGTFPAEIPTTAKPNHHLSPSFPRNPLSPPSAPVQMRLQSPPAKSKFLAVIKILKSVRNLLVHNASMINSRYIKQVGKLGVEVEEQIGEELKLDSRTIVDLFNSVGSLGSDILIGCAKK